MQPSADGRLEFAREPWVLSALIHSVVLIFALFIAFHRTSAPKKALDIEVLEASKVTAAPPPPVQVTHPKIEKPQTVQHQVFGMSRQALSSEHGETVKAGNTIAKAPDQEKLKPTDVDSLPVPSEEYLITKMPELKSEVRIPYPPDAKKKGLQGAVVMDLLIDATGKVREVTLVDGPADDLNAAAVQATKNFEFTPALIQDKAVAVRIHYAYRFVLEH